MSEHHPNEKGVKPDPDVNFDRWWRAIKTVVDRREQKGKKPIDIWAAVPQTIIKVASTAKLDISLYDLWDQFFRGLVGFLSRRPFSIFDEVEVPPPRSIDPRLVFSGSLPLVNLRGLLAMAEQGVLSPEDQLRHVEDGGRRLDQHGRELPAGRTFVHPARQIIERPKVHGKEGIRAKGEPEKEESEDELPFGPGDGHHSPEEKEMAHWPRPALRGTPTSMSANQSSHVAAAGQAPRRVTPKPRYTYANIEKWRQARERRELNDPPPAGSVRYNRVPPTAELAMHIPGDAARAAAQSAKRVEEIQKIKETREERRQAEAAARKPTISRHTNAGEAVKVVVNDDFVPGQAPVYQPPPGWPSHRPWAYFHSPTNRTWALLEKKEEKSRRLAKRQATTKQQTASQPPRSRLPPHLRVIEEAKQAKREAAAKLEQQRAASQPEQGGPTPSELPIRTRVQSPPPATPTAAGAVLDPEEDIYGVSDDEERGGAIKAEKTKQAKAENGQVPGEGGQPDATGSQAHTQAQPAAAAPDKPFSVTAKARSETSVEDLRNPDENVDNNEGGEWPSRPFRSTTSEPGDLCKERLRRSKAGLPYSIELK
ncbi:hypothetical protein DL769_000628 [Monosporascus sp. CRB-8-3]|nr:hypothetical protein DL769_000628 [Monosporascus sp. CRB-8-3]